MEEIKICKYNADNDTIDIVKSNGSKLVWLKDNGLFTYAELVLTGRLQEFLDKMPKVIIDNRIPLKSRL